MVWAMVDRSFIFVGFAITPQPPLARPPLSASHPGPTLTSKQGQLSIYFSTIIAACRLPAWTMAGGGSNDAPDLSEAAVASAWGHLYQLTMQRHPDLRDIAKAIGSKAINR